MEPKMVEQKMGAKDGAKDGGAKDVPTMEPKTGARGGAKDGRPAYDDVIQGESGIVNLIERTNGEARFMS